MGQTNVGTCSNLPFGDAIACSSGSAIGPYHFTGQYHDNESDLDYFQARHYSSSQARFVSPDPAGLAAVDPNNPASWNRYAYVNGNPLAFVDPLGLQPCNNASLEHGSKDHQVSGPHSPNEDGSASGDAGLARPPAWGNCAGWGRATWPRPGSRWERARRRGAPNYREAGAGGFTPHAAGQAAGQAAGLRGQFGISRQVVVSPSGQAAFVTTFAFNVFPAGFTIGAGAIGGFLFSASDATSPGALGGTSLDSGLSVAYGIALGGDFSTGSVSQLNITLGTGFGGFGGAGTFQTSFVEPICGTGGQ